MENIVEKICFEVPGFEVSRDKIGRSARGMFLEPYLMAQMNKCDVQMNNKR